MTEANEAPNSALRAVKVTNDNGDLVKPHMLGDNVLVLIDDYLVVQDVTVEVGVRETWSYYFTPERFHEEFKFVGEEDPTKFVEIAIR